MEPSLGQCVQLACVWEVTARKAGNVHRDRDFANLYFTDFLASAAAIAPVFERAIHQSVGETILAAIQATRAWVTTNTNLGIVLLLAPLAAVPLGQPLKQGVPTVLSYLDTEDSRKVFAAIRLANPGGLGKVSQQDLADEPSLPLGQVMALAAERDFIARQYGNDFKDVFELGLPALLEAIERFGNLEEAIVFTQLTFLAHFPDSLIRRKRGPEEAEQARHLSIEVLKAGWPRTSAGKDAFTVLDEWLTALGNVRNPGTSADMVTACLFAALREKKMPMPFIPFNPDYSPQRHREHRETQSGP